jgi:hypothetical protein
MTGVTTKRVSAPPTQMSTKRVASSGQVSTSMGTDTWGGTWGGGTFATRGNSWGNTWDFGTIATSQSPSVNATKRVGEVPEATLV